MNYRAEYDVYIDIVLIVYTFCAKILLFSKVDVRRYLKGKMPMEEEQINYK